MSTRLIPYRERPETIAALEAWFARPKEKIQYFDPRVAIRNEREEKERRSQKTLDVLDRLVFNPLIRVFSWFGVGVFFAAVGYVMYDVFSLLACLL